ncbi:MAG: hypothetical protein ACXWEI_23765 [Mycobacterium sp.]
MSGFFDPKAFINDPPDEQRSTARRKTGMFMHVHPGHLEVGLGRTSSIPGSPRMNNLLKDHS